MKVTIISDTHGLHEELPQISGDLLIHCGDFEDTAAIDEWFGELDFQQIVVVGGNHDFDAHEKTLADELVFQNAEFLVDRIFEYKGFKIYGAPWLPNLEGFAFFCPSDEIGEKWDAIPSDTDILITHIPPLEILDGSQRGDHWGCEELHNRVQYLSLRIHCFGHVHASYGTCDRYGITFINAANINGGEISNQPIELEL